MGLCCFQTVVGMTCEQGICTVMKHISPYLLENDEQRLSQVSKSIMEAMQKIRNILPGGEGGIRNVCTKCLRVVSSQKCAEQELSSDECRCEETYPGLLYYKMGGEESVAYLSSQATYQWDKGYQIVKQFPGLGTIQLPSGALHHNVHVPYYRGYRWQIGPEQRVSLPEPYEASRASNPYVPKEGGVAVIDGLREHTTFAQRRRSGDDLIKCDDSSYELMLDAEGHCHRRQARIIFLDKKYPLELLAYFPRVVDSFNRLLRCGKFTRTVKDNEILFSDDDVFDTYIPEKALYRDIALFLDSVVEEDGTGGSYKRLVHKCGDQLIRVALCLKLCGNMCLARKFLATYDFAKREELGYIGYETNVYSGFFGDIKMRSDSLWHIEISDHDNCVQGPNYNEILQRATDLQSMMSLIEECKISKPELLPLRNVHYRKLRPFVLVYRKNDICAIRPYVANIRKGTIYGLQRGKSYLLRCPGTIEAVSVPSPKIVEQIINKIKHIHELEVIENRTEPNGDIRRIVHLLQLDTTANADNNTCVTISDVLSEKEKVPVRHFHIARKCMAALLSRFFKLHDYFLAICSYIVCACLRL
jgi:hypothetical protein